MKSIGIVRKIDSLGRIVLPKETRKLFNIKDNDPLEIFIDEDKIVLKKYVSHCAFCDNAADLVNFKGCKICRDCIENLCNKNEHLEQGML